MSDNNNEQQNNGKQKGGNALKNGITLGTSYSAVNNLNLGETIRGALADSFGYMMGAIFTGVASFGLNKMISKFKPEAKVPAVFPAQNEGPSSRELMGQLHNLARTNPDEAKRILDSVGSRFKQEQPALAPTPVTPAPKQEVPAPSKASTKTPKSTKGEKQE